MVTRGRRIAIPKLRPLIEDVLAPQTILRSEEFPVLDEAQIGQLADCTAIAPKHHEDGETLIAVGDCDLKFFVVKSGEVEILDYSGDEPKTITIHRKSSQGASRT